jgi:uncharacterized membrane protein YhaH (DUF805 family)
MNLVRLCFSFYGRVNRAKYWIGLGIAYGMMFATLLPFIWIEPETVYWNAVGGLWVLSWTVAWVAVATKRLHDLDISGWWLLFGLFVSAFVIRYQEIVTIALAVGIIWLGSAKGTEGSNSFGPDPIARRPNKAVS